MKQRIKEIVIQKHDAVFWLDKNGCWHNENGKFTHKKIIQHFHSCIRRDRQGYYLYQAHDTCIEKVYFPYEDQALFVFDVVQQNDITLVLNTQRQVKLNPHKLFVKNDCLYMRMGEETIKFAEQALMKIAPLLQEENSQYHIRLKDSDYRIPEFDD